MRRQCRGRPAWPGQEQVTIAAEPPGSPVTEAVRSLEVRWIFPGQPAEVVLAQDWWTLGFEATVGKSICRIM
jgi:hypothetical protein